MYLLNDDTPDEIEESTFAELGKKESDIEELLRKNISMLCEDAEDSMLIVGQQVRNAENGRCDLIAIDKNGDIVLIEIKRDKKDISHRKEAFEFQAIRYAASCATIKDKEDLITNIFMPYIERHKKEFSVSEALDSGNIARNILDDFISTNNIRKINEHQRIFLVASDFDTQTLSAVAWLDSNNVDISCFQIKPYKIKSDVLIEINKILPVADYDDFFVDMSGHDISTHTGGAINRTTYPKIDELLENHVVNAGAVLRAKNRDSEAILQKDGQVKVKDTGKIMSLQQWLKGVYGWSSVETYALTVDVVSDKTLAQLRKEYMKRLQDRSR